MKPSDVEALTDIDVGLGPEAEERPKRPDLPAYYVFEYALERAWVNENPVRRAAKPKRRRGSERKPGPAVSDDCRARCGDPRDSLTRSLSVSPRRLRKGRPGPGSAGAAGRARARAARLGPRGRYERPASLGAARAALAGCRLAGAADPVRTRTCLASTPRAQSARNSGQLRSTETAWECGNRPQQTPYTLIAHSAGGRKVAGSNPVAPTTESPRGGRLSGVSTEATSGVWHRRSRFS